MQLRASSHTRAIKCDSFSSATTAWYKTVNDTVHAYGRNRALLSFGSNLSARKMRERGTRFISRESAVLRGFRVVFCIWKDDRFGYANIIPDMESTVYGVLYICLKGSLAKLDEHEAGRLRRVKSTGGKKKRRNRGCDRVLSLRKVC